MPSPRTRRCSPARCAPPPCACGPFRRERARLLAQGALAGPHPLSIHPPTLAAAVVDSDAEKTLRLVFARGVSADQVVDSFSERLVPALGKDSAPLKSFQGFFKGLKIDKGTVLTFSANKGSLIVASNGKQVGAEPSPSPPPSHAALTTARASARARPDEPRPTTPPRRPPAAGLRLLRPPRQGALQRLPRLQPRVPVRQERLRLQPRQVRRGVKQGEVLHIIRPRRRRRRRRISSCGGGGTHMRTRPHCWRRRRRRAQAVVVEYSRARWQAKKRGGGRR